MTISRRSASQCVMTIQIILSHHFNVKAYICSNYSHCSHVINDHPGCNNKIMCNFFQFYPASLLILSKIQKCQKFHRLRVFWRIILSDIQTISVDNSPILTESSRYQNSNFWVVSEIFKHLDYICGKCCYLEIWF